MDGAQLTAVITAALGSAGLLAIIANGIFNQLTGRAANEKTRNADLKTQRDDAWAERDAQEERASREQARADKEARNRNRWADLYSDQRRKRLAITGEDPDTVPTEPARLEKD